MELIKVREETYPLNPFETWDYMLPINSISKEMHRTGRIVLFNN